MQNRKIALSSLGAYAALAASTVASQAASIKSRKTKNVSKQTGQPAHQTDTARKAQRELTKALGKRQARKLAKAARRGEA